MLVVARATPAGARPPPDPIEIGGFAGGALFTGSGPEVPDSAVTFGVRGGYALTRRLTLEAEVGFVPTATRDTDLGLLVVAWRAHALLHLPVARLSRRSLVPYVAVGGGGMTAALAEATADRDTVRVPLRDADTDPVLDAGLGVKFVGFGALALRLDGRVLVDPAGQDGVHGARFELLLGAHARLGGGGAARPGPPVATDPDEDLLHGEADRCPEQAEDKDGFQDEDGCPEPDNDGDALADGDDACPDVPETPNGVDDEDGCPETDDDGDGVVGSADRCPLEPEDADGVADDDGCADLDDDGDGIPVDGDRCPAEPEVRNGVVDDDGCPDEVPAEVARLGGELAGVAFRRGADALSPAGRRALDRAAKVLAAHPSVRVEIAAHTDAKGEAAALVELSARRAEAVKAHLVARGVDASRLETVGFGPERPVTRKGREAAVERVELRILVAE